MRAADSILLHQVIALRRPRVVPAIPAAPLQRMQTRYRTLTGELLTLREVAQRHGQSVGLVQMVGTPSQVADQMEDYFDQVGGDGFMLSPIYSPGAIEEFVDLVVPELQRRGRYRGDYAGTTQREHLMQED